MPSGFLKRSLDRWIYVGVASLIFGFYVYISLTLYRTAARVDDLEFEIKVRELASQLEAPSEALYFDEQTLAQIVKLRHRLYQAQATNFVPYRSIARAGRVLDYAPEIIPTNAQESEDQLLFGSYENYWNNRAFATAELIYLLLNDEQDFGYELKRRPALINRHIRPHLERMLYAYSPWVRSAAAKSLFALGDRGDVLKRVLTELSESTEGSSYAVTASELLEQF